MAGKLELASGDSSNYHTTTVTNVCVHNSSSTSTASIKVATSDTSITGNGFGSAGGLIGRMSGDSIADGFGGVYASAASVPVSSAGDAGGLIGRIEGMTRIVGCYSGGYTVDLKDKEGNTIGVGYSDNTDPTETTGLVNVISTGTSGYAGGLVGNAGKSAIQSSYSTCSASGATVGGFVGVIETDASAKVAQLKNCYAAGLVKKKTDSSVEGAFAGSIGSGVNAAGCNYYEVINEREMTENDKSLGYVCLGAVGGEKATHSGITALDAETIDENGEVTKTALDNYQDFVTKKIQTGSDTLADRDWADAVPYNETLKTYYDNTYNFRTVEQLGYDLGDGYYVAKHYGDWPSPEAQIVNISTAG